METEAHAEQVGDKLRAGYNGRDAAMAMTAIADAEARLDAEEADPASRARFWRLVDERFHSGRLLMEKQETSALHALMRRIEAELARLIADADLRK